MSYRPSKLEVNQPLMVVCLCNLYSLRLYLYEIEQYLTFAFVLLEWVQTGLGVLAKKEGKE